MMTSRLRGALAAALLLAATIGLPLALARTVGDPLRAWPSLHTGQLSDADVTAILAAVFYLAWVSFLIPVLTEIAMGARAWITRRPRRELRLPLLGAQQDLARHLISAVLVLLPVSSTALAVAAPAALPAAASSVSAVVGAPHHTANPAPGTTPPARRYVIPDAGGMRSYWALAEHYLGDGRRWREIWHLNEGRVHFDGTVMSSPRRLFTGWTVLIPAEHPGATGTGLATPHPVTSRRHQVRVRPGETLSGLADADHVGWAQVWAENRDRSEPDGERLTNPELIKPGWHIALPDHPHAANRPTSPPGDPSPQGHRPEQQEQVAPPEHAQTDHAANKPAPVHQQLPDSVTVSPAPTRPAPSASPRADPTRSSAPADHTPASQPAHHELPVPLMIGLAAAAAVAVLDRARRIAQRRRRVGHRPVPPTPELVKVEGQIRRDARRAQPMVAAVELATALTGTEPVAVRVVVARTDGAVDLHLRNPPPPPAPFVEITGGWRLPADAIAYTFAVENPEGLDDPCPVLVPVGTTVDGEVLVDLAATGPVAITGDPAVVEAYLRQIVDALSGAPWAGRVQFCVPPRLAERLDSIERLTIQDSLSPRPPAAERHDPGEPVTEEEPGWRTRPIYLYCGWAADADITAVLQAAGDPHRDVHILVNGAHPQAVTWSLYGDELTLPDLNEPVTVTLPDPGGPDSVDLIRYTAAAPDVPVGDPQLPGLTVEPVTRSDIGDPDMTPPADGEPRRLLLLGPIDFTGPDRLRRQVLNLVTFLALHPRGVDRFQMLAAMWPEQNTSLQSMRNRIREARVLLNGAISDGPIWQLDDTITSDWQQFTALAAGTADQQHRALGLIRGRPFTGLDDAEWIDLEGFRSDVEATIVDLALTVSERDFAEHRYPAAYAAARAGLLASRYEERLHRVAIRAALAQGLKGLARTMQGELRTALDIDIEPDDRMQPETVELSRQIRDRRRVGTHTTPR
jgi:hypothetical protein